MKLIVNADDLGYSPGINRGIIYGFREGIITSTTLMINQKYSGEGIKLAKTHPGLGTGIHINLTKEKPVSGADRVPSLLDRSENFWDVDNFYRKHIAEEEVQAEAAAQIQKAVDSGLNLTHIDAHHHLQFHPVVIKVLIQMAKKYKLPLRNVNEETRDRFRNEGIPTPDIFISSFFSSRVTIEYLSSLLTDLNKKHPGATIELMTHPGILDYFSSTTRSSYHEPRQKELETLCSGEIKELINSLKIEL
ncbi:MAG: chitooligosaccharide deacetylase, partial [Firmicutes bacterium HGW-Firmicutes-13]